jgi:hypothetical protein
LQLNLIVYPLNQATESQPQKLKAGQTHPYKANANFRQSGYLFYTSFLLAINITCIYGRVGHSESSLV